MRCWPLMAAMIGALFVGGSASARAETEVPADYRECGLYAYRAELVRVVDGDTIVADIDLGFHTWRRGEHLRLAGINAPELRGESRAAGQRSTEALTAILADRPLTICTVRDRRGKYGRYLAWLFIDAELLPVSVNTYLVQLGLAAGSGRQAALVEAQAAAADPALARASSGASESWALGAHTE